VNVVNVIFEIARKETISYYSQKSALLRNTLFLLLFSYLTISQTTKTLGQYGYTSTILSITLNVLMPLAAIFPVTMASGLSIMAFPVERDQKTLEYLLSLPVSNREIFLGKFLAALATGLAGMVLIFAVIFGYLLLTCNIAWDAPLLTGSFSLMLFLISPMLVILLILATVVISSHISSRELYIVNVVSMFVLLGLNVAAVTLNVDALTFNEGLAVVLAAAIVGAYLLGTRTFNRESLIKSL
jgi:ABC-2 type transport system permease protein